MPGAAVLSDPHDFIDVAPMISALRFRPADFEYARGHLVHVPSRHRFRFDAEGRMTIMAACGCSGRSIKPEQSRELYETFLTWRADYWTNKEFAEHFREPGAFRALFRDVRMALRRFLGSEKRLTLPAPAPEVAARRSEPA